MANKQPAAEVETAGTLLHKLLIGCSLLVVGAIYLLRYHESTDVFQFHFNPFALLSLTTIVVNVSLATLIFRLRQKSDEASWFLFYILAISWSAVGEFLQRLSATPAAAVFWNDLSGVGLATIPVALYVFASSYIRPLRKQNLLLVPILLLAAGTIGLFAGFTNIFYEQDPSLTTLHPWGYITNSGPGFLILLGWVEIFIIAALLELLHFYRTTTNDLLKRQTHLYIIAIFLPLIGGTLTDGILPLFHNYQMPTLAVLFCTITSVVIYLGIKRYHLFQINPAQLTEKVLATMQEAVVVTRSDFRIDVVNREAEHLFGLGRQELSDRFLYDLVPKETWDDVGNHLHDSSFQENDIPVDKHIIKNQSGKHIPVRIASSKLTDDDNKFVAYIFVITNISAITHSYHRLEENAAKIKQQNDELEANKVQLGRLLRESRELERQLTVEKSNVEHTVDIRTRELRKAQEDLRAADKLKTEFIVLSSHNLRTPLAIMRTVLDILGSNKDFSAEQSQQITMLRDSTDKLSDLIEDILTIVTLESGEQLKLEPMSADALLTPLIAEAKSAGAAAQLNVTSDIAGGGTIIHANPLRLRSAIRNVINNAIKFTEHGSVNIAAYAKNDRFYISVSDTGIGIPAAELDKIFTMFHRATSLMEYNYEGKGIGLYITKLILEEHHGAITAKNSKDGGAEFIMELPIAGSHAATDYPEPRQAAISFQKIPSSSRLGRAG